MTKSSFENDLWQSRFRTMMITVVFNQTHALIIQEEAYTCTGIERIFQCFSGPLAPQQTQASWLSSLSSGGCSIIHHQPASGQVDLTRVS